MSDRPPTPRTPTERVQFLLDTGHDRATAEQIVYFEGSDVIGPDGPLPPGPSIFEIRTIDVAADLLEAAHALETEEP